MNSVHNAEDLVLTDRIAELKKEVIYPLVWLKQFLSWLT